MPKSNQSFLDQVVGYITALNVPTRRELAKFLGVKEQTVRSWMRGKSIPAGVRSLRMHYLLEQTGIDNHSWRCEDTVLQDVGRLVAFHLITVDDIVERINDEGVDSNRMVQFLGGYDHVKDDYLKVLKDIVHEYSWDLPEVLKSWDHLFIKNVNGQKIATLANKICSILPLCESMLSDDWTPEDRQLLRARCGQDTVFHLYNVLGALCGEQARSYQMRTAGLITQKKQ